MEFSTAVWLVSGTGLLLIVATWRHILRRRRPEALGFISGQWIAQHRAATHDPNR